MWRHSTAMPVSSLLAESVGCDALITSTTDPVDSDLLDAAATVRAISQVAVGVDNIDVAECTSRGVPVGHTPDVLTETTADTAWALLAASVRRIPEGHALVASGEWAGWRPDLLLGGDLHGCTLGIVGLGRIGAAVARRAAGFEMRLVYAGPRRKPHLEAELRVSHRSLHDLLAETDAVVVTVPLGPGTTHLLGPAELATMQPHSVLVNVARGPVVDTDALVEALADGRPGWAALDVTDPEPLPAGHPLVSAPNCLITPHIGSASHRTRRRMSQRAIANVVAFAAGRPMPWCVNPDVYLGDSAPGRLDREHDPAAE